MESYKAFKAANTFLLSLIKFLKFRWKKFVSIPLPAELILTPANCLTISVPLELIISLHFFLKILIIHLRRHNQTVAEKDQKTSRPTTACAQILMIVKRAISVGKEHSENDIYTDSSNGKALYETIGYVDGIYNTKM